MITIDEQIQAVERELKLRRTLYPKWIEKRKIKKEKADYEIKAMEAVLESLKYLKSLIVNTED